MIGDAVIHRDAGTYGEVVARRMVPVIGNSQAPAELWLRVRFEDGFECWCLATSLWSI